MRSECANNGTRIAAASESAHEVASNINQVGLLRFEPYHTEWEINGCSYAGCSGAGQSDEVPHSAQSFLRNANRLIWDPVYLQVLVAQV